MDTPKPKTAADYLKEYLTRDVAALDAYDAETSNMTRDPSVTTEHMAIRNEHRKYLAVKVLVNARALVDVWGRES